MSPGALAAAFISLLRQRAAQPSLLGAADRDSSGSAVHEQQQSQQLQHPTQQLLQHAVELAPELQPYQASLILYVCAKCQLQCQQQLLGALLQQLQPQALQHLPPTGLVNAFWALAVLQVTPDPAWLEAFYTASSSCRSTSSSNSSSPGGDTAAEPTSNSSSAAETNSNSSSAAETNSSSSSSSSSPFEAFNAHQQVQLLWAAGRLKQQPPPAWLTALLSSLQPKLTTLSPTELTNAMWGLSRIGFRPGRLWLGLWFLASKRAVPYSSPDCLACQAASLAVLRVHLSSGRWAVAFRAAVWQQLPSMQPKHIASLLCGLAKQRSRCPPHWVRAVLLHQLQLLSSSDSSSSSSDTSSSSSSSRAFSPCRELAATVWALPILLHPTAVPWAADRRNAALLKQLAALSLPLLPSGSVAELVQLAVGFARLGFYPGAHWLKTHENAVAQHRLSLTDVNRWRLQAAVKLLWKDS